MQKNNKVIGFLLIILCCVTWLSLPRLIAKPVFALTGFSASVFPKFSLILLLILSTMLLVTNLKKKNNENITENNSEFKNQSIGRVILGLTIIMSYVFLFQYLGFILGTLFVMICFMWFFRVRNLLLLIFIPLLTTALVYIFFEIFLKVQLPDGIFIF